MITKDLIKISDNQGSSCDDQLSSDFDNNGTNFTKNDYMAAMIGEQPSGDITILAPEYLQE
ncbi:hypothetical protein DCAR_0101351 [Daucus carota subsp. sativus]|uniref:Uncharacterized protein n=1 Tax=Daucus carota subsp. sativus TaxID=79200 RepID=A0A166GAY5_DAUCS|nr:hypothetical protein DCAR_0101351 [Daucus carota subsp. sativus]